MSCESESHLLGKLWGAQMSAVGFTICWTLFWVSAASADEPRMIDVGVRLFTYSDSTVLSDRAIAELESKDETVADDSKKAFTLRNPRRAHSEIRQLESKLLAYLLKERLVKTQDWGVVRVTPEDSELFDLMLEIEILQSSGYVLQLAVRATDSRGEVWKQGRKRNRAASVGVERKGERRIYRLELSRDDFPLESGLESLSFWEQDPYCLLFDTVIEDLAYRRQKLLQSDYNQIKQLTALRYASQFAPDVFGDRQYFYERKGKFKPKRSPNLKDPLFSKTEEIQEIEMRALEAFDVHYAKLFKESWNAYYRWRHHNCKAVEAYWRLRGESRKEKAFGVFLGLAEAASILYGNKDKEDMAITGALLLPKSYEADDQGNLTLKAESLSEPAREVVAEGEESLGKADVLVQKLLILEASFSEDVPSTVLPLWGDSVAFDGTVKEQFSAFRALLQKHFRDSTNH